ncbi:MAG: response regulator [Planctomycetes bacterium]|nr:response regulator [Planctomycetota bacterium]
MTALQPVVICIDDDPPVLAAVRRLLRKEPFELITTVDPVKVLELLSTREVNLIIADQRMPSMLGTDLLKTVRQRSPKTACVILTGHADLSDIAGAMNDGAVDRLIRKPWDDEGFRSILRDLLRRNGRNGTAAEPPRKQPADEPVLPPRIIKRLACSGKTPVEVLANVVTGLESLGNPPSRVAFVFDDLLKLSGSLTLLLSEVVRLIVRSGARAAFVDGSGSTGNFLELVGGRLPIVVYESEAELTAARRILIVEDQDDSLEFLRTLIESAGHSCEEAGSVEQALQKLTESTFDLVLLDLVLPDAEGIEVARHILEHQLRIPVVAISGFLDRWTGDSITQAGIRKQVSKPYRARDILDAIRDS